MGIPSLIGTIIGADDFCSVWNFPLSAVCIQDPSAVGEKGMPAWCAFAPDGVLCPGTEPLENPETGLNWDKEHCFNSEWESVPCLTQAGKPMCYNNWMHDDLPNDPYAPCYLYALCYSMDEVPVNCNMGKSVVMKHPDTGVVINTSHVVQGKCTSWNRVSGTITPLPSGKRYLESKCYVSGLVMGDKATTPTNNYQIDQYMRMTNYDTGLPLTNEDYAGGYPILLVYPPEEEPEPETGVEVPPVPEVPTESCGVICDWLALIHSVLFSIDTQLVAFLDYMEQVITSIEPVPFPEMPVFETGLGDKLSAILEAIDDISVEMVKEAGTNFWDVLGGAFGDIFDFVEFLIEKVIYLVIPEDSSSIVNAFDLLRADLMGKVSPIHEIQQHITGSIPNEKREFENIAITLPRYGEVTFFKTDYLLQAIPFIRQLLSAIMVLLTAIWAYRKVSSEMIK